MVGHRHSTSDNPVCHSQLLSETGLSQIAQELKTTQDEVMVETHMTKNSKCF